MPPDDLMALAKADQRNVGDLLSDFIGMLHREGNSSGYMGNYL
jgi:hypothetical protein